MKDVIYQELETPTKGTKVGILMYVGEGDPIKNLNEAVDRYTQNDEYREFIDANMDNPWVRVIVKGINNIEQVEFNPEQQYQ